MAKNLGSRPVKKALGNNIYGVGEEVGAYIEECRQYIARARRQELIAEDNTATFKLRDNGGSDKQSPPAKNPAVSQDLAQKEESLRKLEADLARREVEIIEKEIKHYSMQQELDKLRPLSGVYRVLQAMATERKLDKLLEVIARETRSILKCDRCSVFVLEPGTDELWTQVAEGLGSGVIHVPLSGNSVVSITARTGQPVNIPDAYKDPRFDPSVDRSTGYHTASILCVPMHNRNGEVLGVFEVLNKSGGPFSDDDEQWLQGLSAVAAGLIEQAQAYREIETFVDKTLETLAQTIDKRDPLTAGHSIRVTKYSLLIGHQLQVPETDMDVLRYAAMMHDYGKIGVPEAILWKNGRLTPEEYALVQTHAKITYDLLINLPFTRRLSSVPYVASCHHEKLDGSGYYRGLKGTEIPYLAKIITVADVFDALTSVRHYRNRMAITKVAEIMESGRDNHFDPDIIDAFFRVPCDRVLRVMESERVQSEAAQLDLFKDITLGRLIELCHGGAAQPTEEKLTELFEQIYNEGLPPDYHALD